MDNIQVSENIRGDLAVFTEALKNSREYLEYRESAKEVENNPELKQKLSDYRLMNFSNLITRFRCSCFRKSWSRGLQLNKESI